MFLDNVQNAFILFCMSMRVYALDGFVPSLKRIDISDSDGISTYDVENYSRRLIACQLLVNLMSIVGLTYQLDHPDVVIRGKGSTPIGACFRELVKSVDAGGALLKHVNDTWKDGQLRDLPDYFSEFNWLASVRNNVSHNALLAYDKTLDPGRAVPGMSSRVNLTVRYMLVQYVLLVLNQRLKVYVTDNDVEMLENVAYDFVDMLEVLL